MANNKSKSSSFRWIELIVGTIILLVLGSLYAWSTYRGTLVDEFGWTISSAQFTFSISMMTFCIGGLVSGVISGKTGPKIPGCRQRGAHVCGSFSFFDDFFAAGSVSGVRRAVRIWRRSGL